MRHFYLHSGDIGNYFEAFECHFLHSVRAIETNQKLYVVSIVPIVVGKTYQMERDISILLLGLIPRESTIDDIGTSVIFADTYVIQNGISETEISIKYLRKIAISQLYASREEAIPKNLPWIKS